MQHLNLIEHAPHFSPHHSYKNNVTPLKCSLFTLNLMKMLQLSCSKKKISITNVLSKKHAENFYPELG